MALVQRFILRETIPGVAGEMICAGPSCHAAPVADAAGEAVRYEHTAECEETRG